MVGLKCELLPVLSSCLLVLISCRYKQSISGGTADLNIVNIVGPSFDKALATGLDVHPQICADHLLMSLNWVAMRFPV